MQVCTAHGAGVCISCCSGYLHTCPAIQNYTEGVTFIGRKENVCLTISKRPQQRLRL